MLRGIKVRILPTQEQESIFWRKVVATRFVYNWGLAKQMERFNAKEAHLSAYELRNELRGLTKIDPEYFWLKELGASVLTIPLFDLSDSYSRFFDYVKTDKPKFSKEKLAKLARKGKKATNYDMQCHPKFKSRKHSKKCFPVRYDRTTFREKDGALLVTLEGCGKVKFQTDLDFTDWMRIYNPRVSYTNGRKHQQDSKAKENGTTA